MLLVNVVGENCETLTVEVFPTAEGERCLALRTEDAVEQVAEFAFAHERTPPELVRRHGATVDELERALLTPPVPNELGRKTVALTPMVRFFVTFELVDGLGADETGEILAIAVGVGTSGSDQLLLLFW